MKSNHTVVRALLLVTQLGISMMVPIVLCAVLGSLLQKKTGSPLWLFLFLFLGAGAAFRNVYYLLKPFYAGDKEREDAELAYIENLKKEGERKQREQEQGKRK